ncbi:MAG: hypothetical protein VZR64_07015 [Eubacterium sp.]|nr:hypothetical protein [Eubacterium sp.]
MNDMTPSKVYEFLKQFSESLENKAKEIDPETRVLISYANTITTIDKLQSDDLEYLSLTISADSKYDACLRSMITMITEPCQHIYDGFGGCIEYNGENIDVEIVYVLQGYDNKIIIHISDSFDRFMKSFDKMYKTACNTKFEFNDGTEEEQLERLKPIFADIEAYCKKEQLEPLGYFDNPVNEPLKPIFNDIEAYCNNVFSQQEVHDKFIEQQYISQGKICRIMHDPDGLLTEEVNSDESAEEIFEENAQGDEA